MSGEFKDPYSFVDILTYAIRNLGEFKYKKLSEAYKWPLYSDKISLDNLVEGIIIDVMKKHGVIFNHVYTRDEFVQFLKDIDYFHNEILYLEICLPIAESTDEIGILFGRPNPMNRAYQEELSKRQSI